MIGLTTWLGEWVSNTPAPPPKAIEIANRGLVDAIGCMVAGRQEPAVTALQAVTLAGSSPGAETAQLLLSDHTARPADAALINATSAHALAMDDVALGCHPSSILMPAVLAMAAKTGASGHEVLDAYVVGFEVLAELVARLPGGPHQAGWHPSGVLGPVAAAAACARLLKLPTEESVHALGISASMGGGVGANFGSQTKALHVGRASSAGVLAALLARNHVTSTSDALECPNGLLALVCGSPLPTASMGVDTGKDRPWSILDTGLSIKRYPICYSLHRVVDAASNLGMRAQSLQGIDRVDVYLGAAQAAMARHTRPRSQLEARYSVEFAVTAGLLAGDAGYRQLTGEFLDSAAVQDLLPRIHRHELDDRSGEDGVFSRSDRVVVHGMNGARIDSGEVHFARGNAKNPIDDTLLLDKFKASFDRGKRPGADTAFNQLMDLSRHTRVTEVLRSLAQVPIDSPGGSASNPTNTA
jgi:2-methylcitrate dehydratase PrpD